LKGNLLTNRLKRWARGIKQDLWVVYLAVRDPRTPWYVKLITAIIVAYALSPIDLIPDFVPVLGYLVAREELAVAAFQVGSGSEARWATT